MKNYRAKDVDSYIASSKPGARPKLEELRKLIKSAIPKAKNPQNRFGSGLGRTLRELRISSFLLQFNL